MVKAGAGEADLGEATALDGEPLDPWLAGAPPLDPQAAARSITADTAAPLNADLLADNLLICIKFPGHAVRAGRPE
jgi:hypothetical protein